MGIRRDFRYAGRSPLKAPGLTSVVVLVISIGVGADTAFFGSMDRTVGIVPQAPDPQSKSEKGATLLHNAAEEGSIEIVASLLSMGLDINVRDDAGATPLFYAARSGQVETVEYLVANGADVRATDFLLATPLHYLFENRVGQRHLETMNLLLAEGVMRKSATRAVTYGRRSDLSVGLTLRIEEEVGAPGFALRARQAASYRAPCVTRAV